MNKVSEIVVIIDKSGSMASFVNDTIGGYNSFIADQKKAPGDANITTVLFSGSGKYEVFQDAVDIQNAIPLTSLTYVPGGSTALVEAMTKAITGVRDRIDAMRRNTDGEGNPPGLS